MLCSFRSYRRRGVLLLLFVLCPGQLFAPDEPVSRPSDITGESARWYLDRAEACLDDIEDAGHRDARFSDLATAYVRLDEIDKAIEFVDRISEKRRADALDVLARVMENRGDEESAEKIRQRIPDDQGSKDPLKRRLAALKKEAAPLEAKRDQARGYALAGNSEKALELILEMPVAARLYSYRLVSASLAEADKHESAREMAMRISEDATDWGMHERSTALGGVAAVQIERGQLDEARKTIAMIAEPMTRLMHLAKMAEYQAEKGDVDAALATMKEIEVAEQAVEPPASAGMLGPLNESVVHWQATEPYLDIARAQRESGNIEGYRESVKRLTDASLSIRYDPESLERYLFQQCMDSRNNEEACRKENSGLSEERHSTNEWLLSSLWLRPAASSVVHFLCEAEDVDEALRVAQSTRDCAARMYAYALIVMMCNRTDLLDELAENAIACKSPKAHYATVAIVLDRHGHSDKAEEVIRGRSESIVEKMDPRFEYRDYASLAASRARRWPRARLAEWIESLEPAEKRAVAWIAASGSQESQNETDETESMIGLLRRR